MQPYYLYFIAILILLTLTIVLLDRKIKRVKLEASGEAATKAIDKISAWTIWLSSLQTGAIASLTLLYNGRVPDNFMRDYAFFTLLFFGMSILLATWLLCSLPSMQLRVKKEASRDNDIYEMRLFQSIPLRFGSLSTLIHTYFIAGLVFFSLFIFAAISAPPAPKKCAQLSLENRSLTTFN